MKYIIKYISGYITIFLVLILYPLQTVFSAPSSVTDGVSTVYFAVGHSSVEANELVIGQPPFYPEDYKLSQLTWKVKDAPVITAGFGFNRGNLRLNLEAELLLSEADGSMDDFDWLIVGNDWSDWSHHHDTHLTDHNLLDINFDYLFSGSEFHAWRFLAGYRQSTWSWEARGGTYIYSGAGFRDLSGVFPGVPMISYEQDFSYPYLGIKYEGQVDKWKFNLQYEYSNWVSMTATDHHFIRDLVFIDDFNDGKLSAYKLGAAYRFSNGIVTFIRYDRQKHKDLTGNTLTRDSVSGAIVGYCENCAAADNSSSILSLGISYSY